MDSVEHGAKVQGQKRKLTIALTLAGGMVAAACLPAVAASDICRQLESELAGAPDATGEYDDAIAEQVEQIEIARDHARQQQCDFQLSGNAIKDCADINSTIDRMNANLDSLQRERASSAGHTGNRDHARIMASLEANGCRKGQVIIRRSSPSDDEDQLGEPPHVERQEQALNKGVIIRRSSDGFQRLDGEYRTLCVRTCDGYFFPMSTIASVGDFQRDQARCEAACPGTNVELFYSERGDTKAGDMLSSVTGGPYRQLPNAFVFKRLDVTREPSCSCGTVRDSSLFGTTPDARSPEMVSRPGSSIVEITPARPATPAPDTAKDIKPVEREIDEDRKVRVVGPTFLPGREEAIDLQAPARKTAR